jgi:hypothetical protein
MVNSLTGRRKGRKKNTRKGTKNASKNVKKSKNVRKSVTFAKNTKKPKSKKSKGVMEEEGLIDDSESVTSLKEEQEQIQNGSDIDDFIESDEVELKQAEKNEILENALAKISPKFKKKSTFNRPYKVLDIIDKAVESFRKFFPSCFIRRVMEDEDWLNARSDFLLAEEAKSTGKLLDPKYKLQPTPSLDVFCFRLPPGFGKSYKAYINMSHKNWKVREEMKIGYSEGFFNDD